MNDPAHGSAELERALEPTSHPCGELLRPTPHQQLLRTSGRREHRTESAAGADVEERVEQ